MTTTLLVLIAILRSNGRKNVHNKIMRKLASIQIITDIQPIKDAAEYHNKCVYDIMRQSIIHGDNMTNIDDLIIQNQAYESIIEQQQRKIDELQEDKARYERALDLICVNLEELQSTLDKLFTIKKAN
jgi:hypothetical protein